LSEGDELDEPIIVETQTEPERVPMDNSKLRLWAGITEAANVKKFNVMHDGKTTEVTAEDKSDAMKKYVSKHGVPLSKWKDVKVEECGVAESSTTVSLSKENDSEVLTDDSTIVPDASDTKIVESEIKPAEVAKVDDNVKPTLEKGKMVKVPADVTAAIKTRVSELKASIEEFDKKGYNDGSVKQNGIDALEKVLDDLKQEDGLLRASMYFATLMSPIQDLFPPKVVKFIHSKN
jgi:hypothetical protein